jgi:hypothetical protein
MVTVWVGSHDRAAGVTWAIDRAERIVDVARTFGRKDEEGRSSHA